MPARKVPGVVFEDMGRHAPKLPFYFRQFLAGPHENFHYLIGDPAADVAAVVDPTFELGQVWEEALADGYRITEAWFTHGHWDHMGGLEAVLERGVEAVRVHEAVTHDGVRRMRDDRDTRLRLLAGDESWQIGSLPVQALHTPGHQPESTCFLVGDDREERALFGGDCLFIGSCGRTDFPGGDTEAMFASMARLRALAGDGGAIHVMPGHHYAAAPHRSLREEARDNPALATVDAAAFAALPFLRG